MQKKIDIVMHREGDWLALYVDNELMYEGHSIPPREVLEALNLEYKEHEIYFDEVPEVIWEEFR